MKLNLLLSAAGASAIALFAGSPGMAQAPVRVPLDTETTINSVSVACTGIGQTRDQPRWRAYPVRVEFADAIHNYMAGEIVTLSGPKGAELLSVRCDGPWLLLKLPDRRAYKVEARLTEKDTGPKSAMVKSPEHGQTRVVLTFPSGY